MKVKLICRRKSLVQPVPAQISDGTINDVQFFLVSMMGERPCHFAVPSVSALSQMAYRKLKIQKSQIDRDPEPESLDGYGE